MARNKVRDLTFGGLMIALVWVTTYSIKIPVPFTQGYIHAGDSMIFLAAILFGWKYGALAGGLGSCLADLMGYPHWALPTLIIKTIMGALVGFIAKDLSKYKKATTIISTVLAAIWFLAIGFIRSTVTTYVNANSTKLIGEIDGTQTLEDVLLITEKLQEQLLWIGILIPLLVLFLALYLRKIDKELFGLNQLLGMMVAGLWMVGGYYIAASIMYGTFIIPAFSIPWNIVQFVLGGVIAYFLILALKKTPLLGILNQKTHL